MENIYLISCTKSKQTYTCRAEEMYMPSAKFRASLEYAKNRVDNPREQIFILSAKYGLLKLDDLIETYDETLVGKSIDECDAWGDLTAKSLNEKFDQNDTSFIILAGYSYVRPLIGKLRHILTPLAGMTMGVSISWLQKNRLPGNQSETQEDPKSNWQPRLTDKSAVEMTSKQTNKGTIPNWEDLLEILRSSSEIQTINWQGKPNLWFRAKTVKKLIEVGPAKLHNPSSNASPRTLSKREYEDLSELYFPWRAKQAARSEIANLSMNSSYIFALMNHFGVSPQMPIKPEQSDEPAQEKPSSQIVATESKLTPCPPRILVPAKQLREKQSINNVPGDLPGWYRWWAPIEAVQLLLESPHLDEPCFIQTLPHMTKGEDKLENFYCLYVGVAINESIRARLNWHINQTHTKGNVYYGSLSTLRQTISSLVAANQSAEKETNQLIDMLLVEYQAMPYAIKSAEARREIESIEKAELKKIIYPLNIKDNEHEKNRQFRTELSKLRNRSKETALKTGFPNQKHQNVIVSLRGEMSEDVVRETLEGQSWLKYDYGAYLGEEPTNVERQLKKIPSADFELCCALLTLLLREEHFCMGTYGERVREGSVDAILDRMLKLI